MPLSLRVLQKRADVAKLLKDLRKPKLALSCVGAATTTEIARLLAPGGQLITCVTLVQQRGAVHHVPTVRANRSTKHHLAASALALTAEEPVHMHNATRDGRMQTVPGMLQSSTPLKHCSTLQYHQATTFNAIMLGMARWTRRACLSPRRRSCSMTFVLAASTSPTSRRMKSDPHPHPPPLPILILVPNPPSTLVRASEQRCGAAQAGSGRNRKARRGEETQVLATKCSIRAAFAGPR